MFCSLYKFGIPAQGHWIIGNSILSDVGWIKSSTANLARPTDETSWLYSPDIDQDPTEDPLLELTEAFEQDVEKLVTDINDTPTPTLGKGSLKYKHGLIHRWREERGGCVSHDKSRICCNKQEPFLYCRPESSHKIQQFNSEEERTGCATNR